MLIYSSLYKHSGNYYYYYFSGGRGPQKQKYLGPTKVMVHLEVYQLFLKIQNLKGRMAH